MRDLDWGIYPYSTASSPTAGGACEGTGLSPQAITDVIGIVKAYTTAVGGGPFPTELLDHDGKRLQEIGDEYGATTKRPRRCGWLDTVILRYGAALNGFTGVAITKLDVLDSFEKIKICTAYGRDGGTSTEMPDTFDLRTVEPVYEEWDGWKQSITKARKWDDLPHNAQAYLRRIEDLVKVPIKYVSVGPQRENIITM
jgi:adenylosuccinate synthase